MEELWSHDGEHQLENLENLESSVASLSQQNIYEGRNKRNNNAAAARWTVLQRCHRRMSGPSLLSSTTSILLNTFKLLLFTLFLPPSLPVAAVTLLFIGFPFFFLTLSQNKNEVFKQLKEEFNTFKINNDIKRINPLVSVLKVLRESSWEIRSTRRAHTPDCSEPL